MTDPARKRVSRSTMLPADLVDRARNAVYWTRMVSNEPATYSALTELALAKEVQRLEDDYNNGQPFEPGELQPGPAPGVMRKVARMRQQAAAGESAAG